MVVQTVPQNAQGSPYEPQIARYKTNLKHELEKGPRLAAPRTPPQFKKQSFDVAAAQWNNFPGVSGPPKEGGTPKTPFIDARALQKMARLEREHLPSHLGGGATPPHRAGPYAWLDAMARADVAANKDWSQDAVTKARFHHRALHPQVNDVIF